MAAIQRTRNTSSFGGIFVAAIAAALLLGAGAGYAARTMSVPMSAPSGGSAVQHSAVSAEYELPAWVEKYVAPQEPRRFRVDEYIDSLSYEKSAPTIDNETIGFTQQ